MIARRLAALLGRGRWLVLGLWLVATVAAGIAAAPLPDRLSGGGWYVPGSDSEQAAEALTSGFGSRGETTVTLVVRDTRHLAAEPAFIRRVEQVVDAVRDDPRLRVSGGYGWRTATPEGRQRFVGEDRRTAVTTIALRLPEGEARRVLPVVQADLDRRYADQDLRVALVGAGAFFGEVNRLSAEGLGRAELVTLPLILLILVLLYRSVVLTLVSLIVGGVSIGLAFGVLSVLAGQVELSLFVQSAATMIGLGVSVDYSLIVISRYVEEYARRRDRAAALAATLRTSGETVLFAGLIVVLATCALFLIDLNAIRSIALGVIVVVSFAVLASVVLLPTVLYLLGDRLPLPKRLRAPAAGRWSGFARRVMARPYAFLALALVAVGLLAAPALQLTTFTPDVRIVPSSSPVRFGYDAMRAEFGEGAASPIQVVVRSESPLNGSRAGELARLHKRLERLDHVSRVTSAYPMPYSAVSRDEGARIDHYLSADRRTAVLEVISDDFASGARTRALLEDVRHEADRRNGPALRIVVGGETAEGVDANAAISAGLLPVIGVIAVVAYLLLLVTFRSVFLPLKAILMNLLSIGATYGVLVLVFQHGYGVDLLGAQHFGHLQNFVPILLLAILFSLSTDYEVFLLNRVREEHQAGADNPTSVARGLAHTAPLISGAAMLMIAVFGGFAFTTILPIQQLGFGLALGILLDATLIRLIVAPAAMRLMGRANWWLPGRRASPVPQLALTVPDATRTPIG
ncbi:MAG: MMPL family transporter [Micromonosporaceae bacterium]